MMKTEVLYYRSRDAKMSGVLYFPDASLFAFPVPVILVCHGAFESKENFIGLAEALVAVGSAVFLMDMHGHGESEGPRYHVEMVDWVHDIQAAISMLESRKEIDNRRIGAFGFSSGGTAVLEAALIDPRIQLLISLDGTVRNGVGFFEMLGISVLKRIGRITRFVFNRDLFLPLAEEVKKVRFASDDQINQELLLSPSINDGYARFKIPGAVDAIMVNTLKRVHKITVPTLVLHGERDSIDPKETAHRLYRALTCEKKLEIIPENGHFGHLDVQKNLVMQLTAEWVSTHF